MNHYLESFTTLSSPIHRWNPKSKVAGLFLLMFAFSLVHVWFLLPVILLVSLSLYKISRIPFRYFWSRFKLTTVILVPIGLACVFLSADVERIPLGPVSISPQGAYLFLLFSIRLASILLLLIILFGSTSFFTVVKVLRDYRLPEILVDIILMTYRYLFELANRLQMMRIAARLRGFKAHPVRSLQTFSSLFGSLFIQSYDQSERVYQAMRLRGYGQTGAVDENPPLQRPDVYKLVGSLLCFVVFFSIEIILR